MDESWYMMSIALQKIMEETAKMQEASQDFEILVHWLNEKKHNINSFFMRVGRIAVLLFRDFLNNFALFESFKCM